MNIVNRLIFNRLTAGQSVALPQVGALRVSQTEARVSSGRVVAPHRSVEFADDAQDAESIIEAIAREGEVSAADAGRIYEDWRAEFVRGAEIDFEASGRASEGVFKASDELLRAMNPFEDNAKKEKNMNEKRKCGWLWWLLGIVIAAAIAVAVLCALGKWNSVEDWARGLFGCGDTTLTEQSEEIFVPATEQTAPEPVLELDPVPATTASTTAPATVVTATSVKYYLIAGVFATPSNADKLIRENRYYSTSYEKFEYKGKTAVSVFSSTSRRAVEQRRFELEDIDRELWILKK